MCPRYDARYLPFERPATSCDFIAAGLASVLGAAGRAAADQDMARIRRAGGLPLLAALLAPPDVVISTLALPSPPRVVLH